MEGGNPCEGLCGDAEGLPPPAFELLRVPREAAPVPAPEVDARRRRFEPGRSFSSSCSTPSSTLSPPMARPPGTLLWWGTPPMPGVGAERPMGGPTGMLLGSVP
jgi:hypothetical protein